jgi:hypothetical protein
VAGVADCRVGWSDGVVVSLRLAMNSPFIGRYRDGAELRRSQHGTGHPALDQTRWRRAARRVKSGQKSGMPGGAIETPGRLPAIRAGRPSSSAGPAGARHPYRLHVIRHDRRVEMAALPGLPLDAHSRIALIMDATNS